ncbi:MAG: VWA domain-containing protein [Clostridia bacterium]|nr:VWA domain-containing protein [Clostridia bacterium]
MRKNLTELVFILDRSGSMSSLKSDTVGGFNSMLEKQKKNEGEALVTTVLFNNEIAYVHDRAVISSVRPMTDDDYVPAGTTALIDAIGETVRHISDIHKYAREEDVPEHTMFIITTDGLENASHRFSSDEVKKMIVEKKEEGWEFLFLGANIDAVETAKRFGISEDRAVTYLSDKEGTALNYEVMSEAVSSMRANAPLKASWKERIMADKKKRENKR